MILLVTAAGFVNARDLKINLQQRARPLGIEPHLVIVFELGAPVDAGEFRRSGLRVVDSSHSRVMVAFADDPELAAFHERLDALEAGIPEGQKQEPYAAFFDAIEDLRPLGPTDRITSDVLDAVRSQPPYTLLRLDVECWHPGEADRAREWLGELKAAVETAEGRYVDVDERRRRTPAGARLRACRSGDGPGAT